MDNFDDEILQSFVEESREHLADIENDLLALEEGGADVDEELINKVFRAAHSIKGGAGFMGLDTIKNLAHKTENVLGMIRSQEIVPNSEVINILLMSFDKLRDMINNANASNDEDISEHTVALAGITSAYLPPEDKHEVSEHVEISLPNGSSLFTVAQFDLHRVEKENQSVLLVAFDLIHDVHRRGLTPLDFLKELEEQATIIDCTVELDDVGTLDDDEIVNQLPFYVLLATAVDPNDAASVFTVSAEQVYRLADDLTLKVVDSAGFEIVTPPVGLTSDASAPAAIEPEPVSEVTRPAAPKLADAPSPAKKKPAAPSRSSGHVAETNLRVNIKLLDNLMNLAGELVLSRNELVQAAASEDQNQVTSATQRINLVTSELQEAIMLTRMQPIGNVFNKFPRVVRDLASTLDKKIELSVSGKDVELDKTIIEGLADPLTHLVRNSADHGIEAPARRSQEGKSETGQIWLKAYHEAGQVNIEISDDGKGIDPEKLAASAVSKGLVTEKQVEAMSDKEKIALIFLPGFSMAEQLTDVSGRGVGMDVVKTNLDKLGGQIDIDSKVGAGTTIRIKLPLTLAIIPSLMISTAGQRYALPMVNVVELLRIPAQQIRERIEQVGDAEVVRLRQELLPILSLPDLLKDDLHLASQSDAAEEGSDSSGRAMNIVVVSAGSFKYGLVVDALHDSEEIVVKPLDQHLKGCRGYAGATIMGNGHVALILDVASLARMANLNIEEITKSSVEADEGPAGDDVRTESLLLFGCSETEKFGVPVSLVGRIERIAASDIEYSGGKKTIKYRGGILPVYGIDEVANVEPLAQRDDLLVIVFNIEGHDFGLLAIPPVDTLDVSVKLDRETLRQTGIRGSSIIEDKTTLIVDIREFIETLRPDWFDAGFEGNGDDEADFGCLPGVAGHKILYAEDSGFFRGTVRGMLEEQGYEVIDAEDGLQAWDLLESHAGEIAMVLTDIEMPNLDGLGLAQRIRADARFQHIPIIALTTLASDQDVERGREIGVTDYQVKLDKDKLISSIQSMMNE